MEKNNYSAEKELLKTIEGSSGSPEKKNQKKNLPLNSSELKSRSFFLFHNFSAGIEKRFITSQGSLNFGAVQSAIKFFVFFLLLFYLISAAHGAYRLNHMPAFDITAAEIARDEIKKAKDLVRDFAYYGAVLLDNNIFMPRKEEEKDPVREATELSELRKLTDNLRIVGISWGEESGERFAMAEDTQKDVTYFLQEGDMILNLEVKRISENKVTLGYRDEEIVLR